MKTIFAITLILQSSISLANNPNDPNESVDTIGAEVQDVGNTDPNLNHSVATTAASVHREDTPLERGQENPHRSTDSIQPSHNVSVETTTHFVQAAPPSVTRNDIDRFIASIAITFQDGFNLMRTDHQVDDSQRDQMFSRFMHDFMRNNNHR